MVLHLIVEQSSTWQRSHNPLSKPRCPHVPTLKGFLIRRCLSEVQVWESTDLEAEISQPQYYCSRDFGSVTFSLLVMQIDHLWSLRRAQCPWVVQCTVSLLKQFPDSYQQSLYLVQHVKVDWNGCLSSGAAWGVSGQWLLKSLNAVV